jgi:nucleoside-diphosphate-sugar epimerase
MKKISGKTVIVTGGAGFIGSNLVELLSTAERVIGFRAKIGLDEGIRKCIGGGASGR